MVATAAIVGDIADIADSVASVAAWAIWLVVAVFLAAGIYLGALVWIERDVPLTGAPPDEDAPVPSAPVPAEPTPPADTESDHEISDEELGEWLDELIAEEAEATSPPQRERIELLAQVTQLRISLRLRNEVNAILYRLEF